MDRAAFIEHFRIVILVEVILRMGSRLSPDPQAEALAAYEALRRAGGETSLAPRAFADAVAPELAGLFCEWQRGRRVDAAEVAGVVFDGLARAGASIERRPTSSAPSRAAD
ncbi:MAG: hypothetical protein KF889_18610 [Alphaproteobacteria bacterium]|nr:hypothetical protein [Alphaproteobacteria bacterium]MCW5743919.1 hypothetical protein [Alphaproteobacteria bacterium]